MKNFKKYYIGACSMLLLLSACNKDLDLKPYQSIEQSQALLTSDDVKITLTGAYNRMGLSSLYGGGTFLYPDMLADASYINWTGTYQELTQMNDQAMLTDNDFVNNNWLYGYEVINQTNNVLANIALVDASDRDRVQGEAEFLRGLTYFDLARLFGRAWNDGDPAVNPAVPIVLTPTTVISTASYVKRATVAQVYAQAIADLTDAEAKLPVTNSYLASKYAASAILARVYLQKGDYTNAVVEADKVIEVMNGKNNLYSLTPAYADEFPNPQGTTPIHVDNTTEDIFAMQVTAKQGINSLNTYYASTTYGGRGDIKIRPNFLTDYFKAGDTRAKLYKYDDPSDHSSSLRCRKFDNSLGNVHIVRLAEMYLIRAEGNLVNGTQIGNTPLYDVDTVRSRAGAKKLSSVVIQDVWDERVRELAFEGGFFLHDAKRTAQNAGPLPYSSPKLVFPIPAQEMNANHNLVQNPGY
jgi:tetratricopeptide (TPR) repeat protein